MEELNTKMDKVLQAVNNLTQSLNNFGTRLTSLEDKFTNKVKDIEDSLNEKASLNDLAEANERISYLESALMKLQTDNVQRESYSKRMNLLIHGLEENGAWETREQTRSILNNFLSEGLKLNPGDISLVDFHRLPQRPIFKSNKQITRPIIIKLSTVFDKQTILNSAKHLKNYNGKVTTKKTDGEHSQFRRNSNNSNSVYITDHLPKTYFLQKKSLLPKFKNLKSLGVKAKWGIVNGMYCLITDDKVYNPI